MMEQADRAKITANCTKLVSAIKWREILPKLIDHGIYRDNDQVVRQWQRDPSSKNTTDIYLKIRNRGPEAFQKFVQCLIEVGQNDLADILQSDKSIEKVDEANKETVIETNKGELEVNTDQIINQPSDDPNDNYYMQLTTVTDPLIIRVVKSTKIMEKTKEKILYYGMYSNSRGIVLIINNISFPNNEAAKRLGAIRDEIALKTLFEQMGLKVLPICRDLKCQEMKEEISKFACLEELRSFASLFVILMSHGNVHGISGVDEEILKIENILDSFSSENCPKMIKKPKVFIFQSCRGQIEQPSYDRKADMNRDNVDLNIYKPSEQYLKFKNRNFSDMILAYSTLPGYEAIRGECNGSWYIQILCEVFMNHAHDTELIRLFQMIDSRLARLSTKDQRCQTSETMFWGFNKKCYLNPGFFPDSSEEATANFK